MFNFLVIPSVQFKRTYFHNRSQILPITNLMLYRLTCNIVIFSYTCSTLPNGHCPRGVLGVIIYTQSPGFKYFFSLYKATIFPSTSASFNHWCLANFYMMQSSYSTAVLYIGIMKVWEFWPKIISPKPAWYLLSDSLRLLVRHSQAQKCLQINSKPLY